MIHVNENACPQNHPCPAVTSCPEGAIIQDDVYSAPHIDHDKCTECGVCTSACRVFTRVAEPVTAG